MKKEVMLKSEWQELSQMECITVTGGGDLVNFVKCMKSTISNGRGAIRTIAGGLTLWGMARMAGMIMGYAE